MIISGILSSQQKETFSLEPFQEYTKNKLKARSVFFKFVPVYIL